VDAITFTLDDFDPAHVWTANADAHDVKKFVSAVVESDGIVLSTPVYKATYTGALKSIVDLIPPDALEGKIALPIATARRAAHLESVARAYSELFGFFRIGKVVPGVFLGDDVIFAENGQSTFGAVASEQIDRAAAEILQFLDGNQGRAGRAVGA
jgi:FMN reductase